MANVTISDLHPVGSDLFSDTENYLTDLNDRDLDIIGGAISPWVVGTMIIALTIWPKKAR